MIQETQKPQLNIPVVRQRALLWWKSLGDDIGEVADKYHRGCETIQEYQIEEIYNKEHSLKRNVIVKNVFITYLQFVNVQV